MQNKGTFESHVDCFITCSRTTPSFNKSLSKLVGGENHNILLGTMQRNVSIVVQCLRMHVSCINKRNSEIQCTNPVRSSVVPSKNKLFSVQSSVPMGASLYRGTHHCFLETTAKTCVPALELKTHAAESVCLQISHALHCDLKGKTNAQHPKPCGHSFP